MVSQIIYFFIPYCVALNQIYEKLYFYIFS